MNLTGSVRRPGLAQQHLDLRVFAEPVGQHAAGRPGTDHHEVIPIFHTIPRFNRERSYLTNDNSIPLCRPDWLSGREVLQSRDGGREEVSAAGGSHPFFKTYLHVVRLIRQNSLD